MHRFILVLFCSSLVNGETLKVYPNTDQPAIATAGIPIAPCQMSSTAEFQLFDSAGAAVPVFAKATLMWPESACGKETIRALKVQFAFDPVQGIGDYTWTPGTASGPSRPESPICEIASDSIKAGRSEPCAYVISRPEYLVTTGIISPTLPASDNPYDAEYYPRLFKRFAQDFDYVTLTDAGNWLFDRPSTNYIQAVRTGNIDYYREAYLSHEFWISKIETTGRNTTALDYCQGGFDFNGKASTFSSGGSGCDTKYIYLQPFKLHLALTGDDSWQPGDNGTPAPNLQTRDNVIRAMAAKHVVPPYTEIGQAFTERDVGFSLQAKVNAFELTLDPAIRAEVHALIDNLHKMQIANPDGRGNVGYLAHSWDKHEGSFLPWIGTATEAYKDATSITVENVIGDGYLHIKEPNSIRITASGNVDVAVSGSAIDNGDGTWTIRLKSPISIAAGSNVLASFAVHGVTGTRELNWNHQSDRIFSPWMQAILADGLWQYYQLTTDATVRSQIADLLLGFGRAVTAYGVDGTRLRPATKDLIESAFGVSIYDSTITAKQCSALRFSPYIRYAASESMATAEMNRPYAGYMFQTGGFADQHTPEALFQVALGIHFETDPSKKVAMQALAADMLEFFENYTCTASTVNYPPRAFNWQNKVDPWGTYSWVMTGGTSPVKPE